MNNYSILILKALRKIYAKVFSLPAFEKPLCEQDPDKVSEIIYDKLMDDKPCMIARFGSTELTTIVNYLGVNQVRRSLISYIKGESLPWWWNENIMHQMQQWSGFFPPTKEKIESFCELMLLDMKEVDILGSWLADERYFKAELGNVEMVQREIQNPFFTNEPWTKALIGKKVLVIHPFAELIQEQYSNRINLFKNPYILPQFELRTLQAVQSLGSGDTNFRDWFEALHWMKGEIDKQDYDICLIGCGAYGFPLAAHVKRQKKKAVHLGGSLQLLFGIKGKRWEDPKYNPIYNYAALMNEHWVRPGENVKPKNAESVEGACYW